MRALAFAAVMIGAASCGLLPPKQGEVVTCAQTWTCGDQVVSESNPAPKFCTDPDDPDRAAQIKQYEKDFADTCAGVPVQCVDGTDAVCSAVCTPKGTCKIDPAPQSVTL